ncbi:MAG: Na+/H+ antiporter NhaC family protein [Faecalibacterium sp.]|nr:Na+/H+ antiporter NhaC family protein [Faecalibacterium sp.]
MKKRNWAILAAAIAALVFLCWRTAVTPGQADTDTFTPAVFGTAWALLPPVIAIVLALLTKEVYSSLFVGILTGALLYAGGNLVLTLNTVFFAQGAEAAYGMVPKLAANASNTVFLVLLGILVAVMNKAGGSAAFGRWASKHIKSRTGAQLATMLLGVLIFVDDYFNCLTVGSVMRPVTDRNKISRAKLAYLIDATAAPVCIIAPISSWAAAVSSSVPADSGINGFSMFMQAIPYNYYALLTIVMMVTIIVLKMDYGPMKRHEDNAAKGDLFTTAARPYGDVDDEDVSTKGTVADLVVPVLVLIAGCVVGMIYTGGFFSGAGFVDAFANCDAPTALVFGSFTALAFTFVFYMVRGVLDFKSFMECIPAGFKAMVAAILILTMAWTLSGMTALLGAKVFVADLVASGAAGLQYFLPMIIFLVALGLAFATGTSWGTFSILIPIVCNVFPQGTMLTIGIAACLAGAVCGDHCSPISDTTIMASAGAHSDHVNHVSTQLPYAMTVAAVSFVSYGIAAFVQNVWVSLVIAVVLMVGTLLVIRARSAKKAAAEQA